MRRCAHSILMPILLVLVALVLMRIHIRLLMLNEVSCVLRSHYFGLIGVILLLILNIKLILWHVIWLAEGRFNIWGRLGRLLVKFAELVSIDGGCRLACWRHVIHIV